MLPRTLPADSYVPKRVKDEIDFKDPIKLGAKKMPAQRVQEFLTLNGFALNIDADFAEATEKRVRDFQAARGLPVTGIVDFDTYEQLMAPVVRALSPIAPAGRTLSALALAYARQHIAQHPVEVGGDNSGPWVRSYLGWDGRDARWCAGFVCFAVEQSAATLNIPLPIASSSSCDQLANEAKVAGKFVPESRVKSGAFPKRQIVPGSFFLVRKVPGDWVHVGMVTATSGDTFDTAEGNTDSGGSSNGFEASERTRGYKGKDFIVW